MVLLVFSGRLYLLLYHKCGVYNAHRHQRACRDQQIYSLSFEEKVVQLLS